MTASNSEIAQSSKNTQVLDKEKIDNESRILMQSPVNNINEDLSNIPVRKMISTPVSDA